MGFTCVNAIYYVHCTKEQSVVQVLLMREIAGFYTDKNDIKILIAVENVHLTVKLS